mgnify:CR=1 FL=1
MYIVLFARVQVYSIQYTPALNPPRLHLPNGKDNTSVFSNTSAPNTQNALYKPVSPLFYSSLFNRRIAFQVKFWNTFNFLGLTAEGMLWPIALGENKKEVF